MILKLLNLNPYWSFGKLEKRNSSSNSTNKDLLWQKKKKSCMYNWYFINQ